MHLKSSKYSGPKTVYYSKLSPSLDSTIADWSSTNKTIVQTVLVQVNTALDFQLGPDLSELQFGLV